MKTDPREYRVYSFQTRLLEEIFDYITRFGLYDFMIRTQEHNRVNIKTEILDDATTIFIFTFRDIRDTMVFELGFGQYITQEYDNYG